MTFSEVFDSERPGLRGRRILQGDLCGSLPETAPGDEGALDAVESCEGERAAESHGWRGERWGVWGATRRCRQDGEGESGHLPHRGRADRSLRYHFSYQPDLLRFSQNHFVGWFDWFRLQSTKYPLTRCLNSPSNSALHHSPTNPTRSASCGRFTLTPLRVGHHVLLSSR